MIFTELRFFGFLAVALAVHWSLASERARRLWLVAASWAFYAAWDWRFLGLLVLTTAIDWRVALAIEGSPGERARRRWLALSIAANLGVLGTFKYCGFFVDSAARLLASVGLSPHLPTLDVVLPWGISFYTFHSLGYVVDVHRGKVPARRSFVDFALFVAFFPQLVAGPIARASAFFPQLDRPRTAADVDARRSLLLFLVGFAKKACLSDVVSEVIDPYWASPGSFTASSALVVQLLSAMQMYCDFSGYTDMARGTAGLFGYELAANFDFPLLAPNPAEYWRRWHMSLSAWFRDYVYRPLGGSRGSPARTRWNILLTMTLVGLWHGAAWRFVAWGALGGVAMLVHRAWAKRFPAPARRSVASLALSVVALQAWLFVPRICFRVSDPRDWLPALRAIALGQSAGTVQVPLGWLAVFGVAATVHVLAFRGALRSWERLPATAFAASYGAAWALALALVHPQATPFVYFQF